MVRLFVAMGIPQEAIDALAGVIGKLKAKGVSQVRWSKPEAIHLTLKFLGEVDATRAASTNIEALVGAMERAARGTGPLRLGLAGLGGFPDLTSPRVVWAGLTGDVEKVVELAARVDRELEQAGGFRREERPFAPHLTLGRLREGASGAQRRQVGEVMARMEGLEEVWWQAEALWLVQSTLTPEGPIFATVGQCVL